MKSKATLLLCSLSMLIGSSHCATRHFGVVDLVLTYLNTSSAQKRLKTYTTIKKFLDENKNHERIYFCLYAVAYKNETLSKLFFEHIDLNKKVFPFGQTILWKAVMTLMENANNADDAIDEQYIKQQKEKCDQYFKFIKLLLNAGADPNIDACYTLNLLEHLLYDKFYRGEIARKYAKELFNLLQSFA